VLVVGLVLMMTTATDVRLGHRRRQCDPLFEPVFTKVIPKTQCDTNRHLMCASIA